MFQSSLHMSIMGTRSLSFLFVLPFLLGQAVLGADAEDPITPLGKNRPITPVGPLKSHDPDLSPLVEGCPVSCSVAGPNPSKWTPIHSQQDLLNCEQPLLFQLNIANQPSKYATIFTCTASGSAGQNSTQHQRREVDAANLAEVEQSIASSETCGADETQSTKAAVSLGPAGVLKNTGSAAEAAALLANYLGEGAPCGSTILFAKSGSSLVGLYAGADVHKSSASGLIKKYGFAGGANVLQSCDSQVKSDSTLGLYAVDGIDGFGDAQVAVTTWAKGGCGDVSGTAEQAELEILTSAASDTTVARSIRSRFNPRADGDCTVITVVFGDSCGSLSSRCGISAADFYKYNPASDLCSTLAVGQQVCCSAGNLPGPPQPYSNGTCYTYTVQSNDICDTIAKNFGITSDYIKSVNTGTWGWSGCDRLSINQKICLSTGNIPMPATDAAATCGPTVEGTTPPSQSFTGYDLAQLNPCELNACCSGYGFCGITEEFCTNHTSDTGAPGSFPAGEQGCISNCGTDIVGNSEQPTSFYRVGYFEAFNPSRPCLNMDATELPSKAANLTHVHLGFAGLNEDFTLSLSDDVQKQLDEFVATPGPYKKIISVGGWAESTEAASFQRFKDAMLPANRNAAAANVVQFLSDHGLDGVDFDWEFPSAPGATPEDNETSGRNYVKFVSTVRAQLGSTGKTISVALPASYTYLKPYLVAAMVPTVDYYVFMTYDFHGQWDYGNSHVIPGCAGGNCLRSHVDINETRYALSMITKAGVPANKVVVGISSYGRSFQMSDPSCTGPSCTYTGSSTTSNAEPGNCTQTAGYLANAEIRDIINGAAAGSPGYAAQYSYDSDSGSDVLRFGTKGKGITDWVAYMDGSTKNSRIEWIRGLNFAGASDWAIDLEG